MTSAIDAEVLTMTLDAVQRFAADALPEKLLLAVASMAYSVWAFRGKPLLHLAHLVTIALGIPLTFFGAVAIVGWT